MDILKDMVEHIRLDFDSTLLVDEEYTSAEEELHRFIENELPPEKSQEIDSLVNAVIIIGSTPSVLLISSLIR